MNKDKKNWEKRADVIWDEIAGDGCSINGTMFCEGALRLGREMASEAHAEGWYSGVGCAEETLSYRDESVAQNAADERAEEIAKRCEQRSMFDEHINGGEAWVYAAKLARSTIRSAPKTREQVLEEALREVVSVAAVASNPSTGDHLLRDATAIARRALEWKPE